MPECLHRPCWQALLLGLAAGSGGSLIGIGGGIIMVPVLTIWGLAQKKAQGTSLVVILALAPVSTFLYWRLGNMDFGFAVPLAIGGVIGSMTGSSLALRFSNRVLAKLFAAFLVIIALRLLIRALFGSNAESCTEVELRTLVDYLETTGFGFLAGLTAGFFGVGGGVVFVPTGVILGGLQQCLAQGSSFTAMIPTAFVATMNYRDQREIAWKLAYWMIPGAWAGAILGSWAADVLAKIRDGQVLTVIFALFLVYTGVSRLINNWNKAPAGASSK